MRLLIIVALAILSAISYWWLFNHVGEKEIGICFKYSEGGPVDPATVTVQEVGWHYSPIGYVVAYIPTDTSEAALTSGVKIRYWFERKGLPDFLKTVPIKELYYAFPGTFDEIMLGFIATGKTYSFLGVDTLQT